VVWSSWQLLIEKGVRHIYPGHGQIRSINHLLVD
jgi:hypothetical protein